MKCFRVTHIHGASYLTHAPFIPPVSCDRTIIELSHEEYLQARWDEHFTGPIDYERLWERECTRFLSAWFFEIIAPFLEDRTDYGF